MDPKILVAVLACDYGDTKHENGEHTLTRLDKALEELDGRQDDVLFIFSAGRLAPEDSRLCDLQAEYVRARGFEARVPPEGGVLIWGSKAELYFLRLQQQLYPDAQVVVISEGYHVERLEAIAKRKVGLMNVMFIRASSAKTPPSRRAILHEKLGLVEAYLPDTVMAIPKWIRRVGLRKRVINY